MRVDLIVVGTSFGGMHALRTVLGGLPEHFPVPLAVVQHRAKETNNLMSPMLEQWSRLPVVDVEDKQPIVPGHVYLAPADYHLLVEVGSFALSVDAPVSYARPSIDVLFESAADAYGDRLVGVILTGANQDGARGAAAIKARGGVVLVQDPATAEGREMPDAAIVATHVDRVLALHEMAPCLVAMCREATK